LKEADQQIKGVFALLLAGAKDAAENLLGMCAIPGATAPAQVACRDRRPDLPLGSIVRRFQTRQCRKLNR